ncbi:rho GTPase-activating protein gacF-like [Diprion similis]|uniref:rho GTPase-activating protein gacF-like n=1 Tax=Diprion similis TaxID=362088 RepID=UPI001EF84390|nr:rho GTPase-activating protein gacF-like [Diprion similis]
MKILLLTCLLASGLAAPAEKTKRDILPGDSRYNAQHNHHHHHHHEDHDHHQNELEISKALDGYFGTYDSALTGYGIPGLQPGIPISSNNFGSTNLDAVEIGGTKNAKQIESSTESSLSVPKVSSVTVVKSEGISQAGNLAQLGNIGISKGLANNFDNAVISTTAASVEASSVPSAYIEEVTKSSSGDGISTLGSFESPFQSETGSSFRSSFDSGLSSAFGGPDFYSVPSSVGPFNAADLSTFEQSSFDTFGSSLGLSSDVNKDSAVSTDTSKETAESASTKIKSSSETVSSEFGSANGGLATPLQPQFSSSFGANFNSRLGSSFGGPSLFSSSLGAAPFTTTGFNTFKQAGSNPIFGSSLSSSINKESATLTSNAKVESKAQSKAASSDYNKKITESTSTNVQTAAKTLPASFGSSVDSLSTPLKSKSDSFFKSSSPSSGSTSGFSTFTQGSYKPSFGSSFSFSSEANKESAKSTSATNVESKSGSSKVSSDAHKTTVESSADAAKSFTDAISSKSGLDIDTLSPLSETNFRSSLGSTFGSGLSSIGGPSIYSTSFGASPSDTLGLTRFESPSLEQTYTYTPSIEGYNNNFGIYNNNYDRANGFQNADYRTYLTGIRGYSGFDQSLGDTTLNGNVQVSYPQSYSSDFTGGVRYAAPQSFQFQSVSPTPQSVTPFPFPTSVSVTEAPTQLNFDSSRSYLSPSIEQSVQPNFYVSPDQQNLFRNYQSTVFSVQPTPSTFPRLSQPEVKISESSLSGITQQTDADGGYIY